jgi:hypothetical protein
MRSGIALIAAMFIMTPVTGHGAPLGVRDVNIGMDKMEVVDLLKGHKDSKCEDNYCTEYAFVIKPVQIQYYFGRKTGKLISMRLTYRNRFNDAMLSGLKEKFGPPIGQRTKVWQNLVGAKFDNTEWIWEFAEGSIVLDQIGEKMDDGVIIMTSTGLTKEEMAAENVQDKKQPGF